MSLIKVFIKAFDLTAERSKVLETGAQYLTSYFRQVLKYGNETLNHKIYTDAICIYQSAIAYSDLSGTEHLLLHLREKSYSRSNLGGSSKLGDAAGVTVFLGKKYVFSEVLWSFVEEAGKTTREKGLALANFGFHELVHNKTFSAYANVTENDNFVHGNGGGGVLQDRLLPKNAGAITANIKNIQTMAAVYALPIKQYRELLH